MNKSDLIRRSMNLVVYLDDRPSSVGKTHLNLSYREELILKELVKANGEWVERKDLEKLIGNDQKTPIKVTLSTLRTKLKEMNLPANQMIVRGHNKKYRFGLPLIKADDGKNHNPYKGPKIRINEENEVVGTKGNHKLTPSQLIFIEILTEKSPHFVSKKEIAEILSSKLKRDITEQRVTGLIWQLRKSLGKICSENLIETKAKTGYRLILQ